ncbi:MAG: glutamate--tRNA ligase [Candidatus Woesearchaeota archaeon]|jgi:glutamyl-tRNA synthetase
MSITLEIKQLIRKLVLQNAVKYNGKASPGAIVGGIIGDYPELKEHMKTLMAEINHIVQEVNTLDSDIQTEELLKLDPAALDKKEKKDDLKDLDNVDSSKGVIMRFAPSPSGPMHIGHAITGGLTSLYVKKYGGKFILRIEDTNSDNIDPDAYELLPKDGEWIFGNVTDVWIQSDRIQIYYDYSEKFLNLGATYICTCSSEDFKKCADSMIDCPCRNLNVNDNLKRWKMMHDKENGYKEGEAVMRFKSGMQNNNPAMRDFPLIRINDSEHPRQHFKYRVWPLMNLSVCVDDIEANMTHIIRAKDHADNAKRQEMMYKALGIGDKFPKTYFLGRYNFEGMEISCSKTKAKIKEGTFTGWDDIRVPFLSALKRRGYQPEAFLRYTKLTGLSPVDKTISAEEFYKSINAFNKDIIDKTSKRFFFVHNYELVKIENAPIREVKLKMHPDVDFGQRTLNSDGEFFLQKDDLAELMDSNLYRLMDCLNFIKENNHYKFESIDHDSYKAKGKKIIHWIPANQNVDVTVLMPDATLLVGKGEKDVSTLNVGDVIQFERFGFCRLDSITTNNANKEYNFWFAHK